MAARKSGMKNSFNKLSAEHSSFWVVNILLKDLLADPNSNWSFEPKSGLKLKKAKIDDSGNFFCKGTYKEEESALSVYLNVSGRSIFMLL
jgi:hypothetical protein